MINQWRYVKYLDDGVSGYQCLQCYEKWQSTGPPGYFYEGVYHATWKFCPCCGTKWDGMRLTNTENDMNVQLGDRRRRIEDAIDAEFDKRQKAYWKSNNKVGGCPYPYAIKEPDWWWVIETREHSQLFKKGLDEKNQWKPTMMAAGGRVPAVRILELHRSVISDELGTDLEGDECVSLLRESRIVMVREADWDTKYGSYNRPYQVR